MQKDIFDTRLKTRQEGNCSRWWRVDHTAPTRSYTNACQAKYTRNAGQRNVGPVSGKWGRPHVRGKKSLPDRTSAQAHMYKWLMGANKLLPTSCTQVCTVKKHKHSNTCKVRLSEIDPPRDNPSSTQMTRACIYFSGNSLSITCGPIRLPKVDNRYVRMS